MENSNNNNNMEVVVIYDSDDDGSVVFVGELEAGETSDSKMEPAPEISINQAVPQQEYEVIEYAPLDLEIPREMIKQELPEDDETPINETGLIVICEICHIGLSFSDTVIICRFHHIFYQACILRNGENVAARVMAHANNKVHRI